MNFIHDFPSAQNMLNDAIANFNAKKNNIILAQLNKLLNQGLLVIEETQPVIVKEQDSDNIVIRQAVRLVLKDQELVNNLKKENEELKAKLLAVTNAIQGDK